MIYLRLAYEFFYIGLFTVGGGMATIPFLYDLSDKTGWFTYQQIADMLAVSESTPGPIGINMATYVGYTVAGPLGGVIATIGTALPGVIIVGIVSKMLAKFRGNKLVDDAFYGLRPASMGLVSAAAISILMIVVMDVPSYELSGLLSDLIVWPSLIIAAVLLVLTNTVKFFKELHPIALVALGAVVGVVLKL